MADETLTLVENFKKYFLVEFANTSIQKEKAYRIRYRVYCDEFKYESADLFPDEQESDEYDKDAQHCLIIHKTTGMPAGCVRIVLTTGLQGEKLLPFEKYCSESLDNKFIENLDLDRRSVCEISRLAVDGAFRRRSGEILTRFGEMEALDCTQQEKRSFSLIAVAAFLASTALTDMSGRTNVFAMMEPFLPRLLNRSGINFQRAGIDINYHGIRAPYFSKTESALNNMRSDLRTLYDWIKKQLEETY